MYENKIEDYTLPFKKVVFNFKKKFNKEKEKKKAEW